MTKLQTLRATLSELASRALDTFSETTGFVAVRDRLLHPGGDDVVTLDVPGYKQTNTFCCGATAGLMILRKFKPNASISAFYRLVDPDPDHGTDTGELVRALKKSGVGVDVRYNLTWRSVRRTIHDGYPIATVVNTKDSSIHHWVVIYGVGVNPNRVYLAGDGLPWIGKREHAWPDFTSRWRPKGFGLVCWGNP